MADRPPKNNNIPEEPDFTGGWRQPQTPGAWRPVRRREQPEPDWRRAASAQDLRAVPAAQGEWHLPKPEDALGGAVAEAEAPPAERPAPADERPDELALIEAARSGAAQPAEAPAEEAQPAPPPEDFDLSDSQSLLQLEEASADGEGAPTLEAADEDDEDAFSMSELMALASLVEQPPKATIVPGVSPAPSLSDTGARPATEPITPITEEETLDPAEYARRQLEQLEAESGAQPQPAADAVTDAEDPAAYARQRLQELGITGAGAAAPAPAAAPLSPEEQELARRFRETEEQVRVLRQQYHNGQITRDQLQAQLRQLMILDNNRNWWMMGLETDTWYRFDSGQWVVSPPPVRLSDTGAEMPRAEGYSPNVGATEFTPGQEFSPASGIGMDYTQPSAAFRTPPPGEIGIDEGPLPRAVPIQDPDRTVVGTAGAYLDPVRDYEAETIAGAGLSQDTVINPNVGVYGSIPSAIPADAEPLYDVEADAPTAEEVAARARQRTAVNILRIGLIGIAGVLLLFACGIGLILVQYSNIANQYQAQIAALANYQPEFQTVRVLDVNGDLITTLTSQQGGARTDVPLDRISPFVIHAVVSLENERFYEDPGWDWIAIFRAFLQNLGSGEVESGASTITQQIARQLVLHDSTVSPQRKLEEIIIASQIAQQYSKNDILELYLNEIYFGNQNYGVEAASQFYFDHSANDLNLPESALLVAMIAAPATYDPVRYGGEDLAAYSARREATLNRLDSVMDKMVEVGCLQFQHAPYLNEPFCITTAVTRQAAAQKAAVEARNYRPREVNFKYPHFVQFVQQQVEANYGPGEMYRRGFIIRTTLNPAIQNVAETALDNRLAQIVNTGVNTGSIMVSDPRNGAIRAMVGSPDFNDEDIDGQVNGALTWQQPGSAIKPVVYLGALEGIVDPNTGQPRYMTPATILWDLPTTFIDGAYTPVNFDGQFRGPVALRYALQGSINVPAVKVFDFITAAKFQDVAGRLGLRFPENAQFGLATALGAVEVTLYDMMVAYGTLANDGQRVSLYAIESITDSNGQPVPLPERPAPVQAVQPPAAFLMQNILSDDIARAGSSFGEGGPLTIQGLPRTSYVAAKTGTTNQNRDLWTVGFTSNAVVGVWMGRPDDSQTFVQGGGYGVVAPLWNEVMQAALRTMPAPQAFTNPGGVVELQICPLTGTQQTPNCPSLRNELFLANQPPPGVEQAFVRTIRVNTWSGLEWHQQYCPDDWIEGTFIQIDDPTAAAWLNTPAGQAYLRQLGVTGGTIETAPPAACDLNTEIPIARITSPIENQQVTGEVQITGAASATNFNRYQLEVGTQGSNTFTIVSGPSQTPQTSGVLGTWDTTRFPNGAYTLRLAMFANNGGYLYRTVNVNVANIPPTPTPTPFVPTQPVLPTQPPLVIPPTIPFAQITPLPFEPVSPP